MVKIQVKMPDTLFRQAKRLSAENEMSSAGVVRRGLEEIIKHHPPGRTRAKSWTLPQPFDLAATLTPEEEWTAVCHN